MSMMGGRAPAGFDRVGPTVASFPSYEAAQKAVSSLIAADVPARDIAIVGTGLRSIERVTGKLGYATAARSGAINGLLLGLLFSAIFVLGTPSPPIQLFVGVLFVGIAIGMLMSIIAFAIVRRRRDYASVVQVVADHYDVTVAESSVPRARQVVGAPTVVAPPAPEPDLVEPPRYGERIPSGGPRSAGDAVDTEHGIEVAPERDAAPAAGSEAQGDAIETADGIVVAPEDPEARQD